MPEQYDRAVREAEKSRQVVEEYLMGPESVQVVEAIGEILLSWEVMVMFGVFLVYRLARHSFRVVVVRDSDPELEDDNE